MERWEKKDFGGFLKDGILTELQAKMSTSCRFLIFWHHNYQVTLRIPAIHGAKTSKNQTPLVNFA